MPDYNISEQLSAKILKSSKSDDVEEAIKLELRRQAEVDAYLFNKKQAELLVSTTDTASDTFGDANTIVNELHVLLHTIKDIAVCIPVLRTIATICGVIHNFAKLLTGIFLNIHTSDSTPTNCRKAFGYYDITVAAVGLTICIVAVSIVTVAPYMMFLTFASDAVMNGWKFFHDAYKLFTKGKVLRQHYKEQKREYYESLAALDPVVRKLAYLLIDKKNKKNLVSDDHLLITKYQLHKILKLDDTLKDTANEIIERNRKLATSISDLMKTLVNHVGIILSVIAPPIGASILIGMAIYSVLDRVGYNPIKWIANKIFNNPFSKKDKFSSIENIKAVVDKLDVKNKLTKIQPTIKVQQDNDHKKPAKKVVYNDKVLIARDSPFQHCKQPLIVQKPQSTLALNR